MLYFQLFITFFQIGLFGFGGGYAMLSLIQGEVVTRYGWLTAQEFTDIVAISQMTPGPIGINSATYVGYQATGSVLGSIIATYSYLHLCRIAPSSGGLIGSSGSCIDEGRELWFSYIKHLPVCDQLFALRFCLYCHLQV